MPHSDQIVIVVLPVQKIASVNDYLIPVVRKVRKKGKDGKYKDHHVAFMTKSPDAKSYQSWMLKKLATSISLQDRALLKSWSMYQVEVNAVFNKSYQSRDVDNILKLTIDALFGQFLKINDNRIKRVISEKFMNPENKQEYLIIKITPKSDDRYKFN